MGIIGVVMIIHTMSGGFALAAIGDFVDCIMAYPKMKLRKQLIIGCIVKRSEGQKNSPTKSKLFHSYAGINASVHQTPSYE